MAVGRRIREMRSFDMTQEEFAERIGISQNYLSTMERGKVEIGAEILLRISREFAKSVEWLTDGGSLNTQIYEDWGRPPDRNGSRQCMWLSAHQTVDIVWSRKFLYCNPPGRSVPSDL